MDDVFPFEPVLCDTGLKGFILTTLNNFDVWYAGTTPQLYGVGPIWFYGSYL